jgi:hypothetical protein
MRYEQTLQLQVMKKNPHKNEKERQVMRKHQNEKRQSSENRFSVGDNVTSSLSAIYFQTL